MQHFMSTPPRPSLTTLQTLAIILLAGLLTACAVEPTTQPTPMPEAAATPPVAVRPFTRDALYGLLVAEFAIHRDDLGLGLQNYLQQAMETRDAGVAARATRLARHLGIDEATRQAATLWSDLEPESAEARFTAATALARLGRAREAFSRMAEIAPGDAPSNFAAIAASAHDLPAGEREEMLAALQQREVQSNDVLIARGLLLRSLQRYREALDCADRVLADDPDNFQALLLGAQLHHDLGDPATGNASIERALERHPGNRRLRLSYARLLAQVEPAGAERELRTLLEQDPTDAEVLLTLAQLYHETEQFGRMREELRTLIETGNHPSLAHFYLAQDAERRDDHQAAIQHYLQVRPGSMFVAAITRAGELLLEDGDIAELGNTFTALRSRWNAQATGLLLLEAELRLEHDDIDGAARLLDGGLEAQPDELSLLYARSLVSERRADVAALERDLRHILRLDPDNAAALNALGYSLTNLTDRHAEALVLIERAMALRPDDPAITDSLGWVLYRLGRHDEALDHLQRAFDAFPDPEVAAHLGEVLWVDGRHDEAREVWRKGFDSKANGRLIRDTMQRLGADPLP